MALQVWLPLNGDLTNNGIGNPTLSVDNATVDNSGKLGKCYSFNGSTSCINITYSGIPNILNGDFSICMWIYNNDNGGRSILFGSYALTGGFFNLEKQTNNKIRFYWNGSPDYNPGNAVLTTSAWTHLIITRKDTLISIYINGVLTDQGTYTLSTVPSTNVNYRLGRDSRSDATAFNGKMNDFRLYSHALSPKEVEILSRGLVLHYPLSLSQENIVPNTFAEERSYTYPSSSYADRWAATTSIIPSASQYILSFWAKSTVDGAKVRAHWYSPNTTTKGETNQGAVSTASDGMIDFVLSTKWEKYWCIYTQSSTTAVKHLIFPRMWSSSAGSGWGSGTVYIKEIKLEEGTVPTPWIPNSSDTAYSILGLGGTTEYDVSGYNYHSTYTSLPTYNSSSARYETSAYFGTTGNPKTSLINTSWLPTLTNGTISWWFKYTTGSSLPFTSDSNTHYIAAGASGTNLYDSNIGASGITMYKDGVVVNTRYEKSGSADIVRHDNVRYNANEWHHFCLTGINLSTWTDFKINAYGSWHLRGYLSDVRIYATALTATQVAELYNTAVSLSNNGTLLGYEFVET